MYLLKGLISTSYLNGNIPTILWMLSICLRILDTQKQRKIIRLIVRKDRMHAKRMIFCLIDLSIWPTFN